MSGRNRTGSTRLLRHRFWWRAFHRTVAVSAMLFLIAEVAVVAVSSVRPSRAKAATPPTGQGFTVTTGDLKFILKQINIAEQHAATLSPGHPCDTLVNQPGDNIPDANQIPDRLTAYGLRTVDGSCNNLFPGRETFAAADQSSRASRRRTSATPTPSARHRAARADRPTSRRRATSSTRSRASSAT